MSEPNLKAALGCYGKLPCTGDFFHRNLPVAAIQSWEHWLQQNMFHSQRILGDEWRDLYLTCPFWRFYLPERTLAEEAVLGVMCPSIDSVGRYFPVTVMLRLTPCSRLQIFTRHCQQFLEHLEDTILAALDRQITSLDDFLEQCCNCEADVSALFQATDSHISEHYSFNFSPSWETAEVVAAWNMARLPAGISLWWCEGNNQRPGVLEQLPGLPDGNTFVNMLRGSASHTALQLPDLPALEAFHNDNPAPQAAAHAPEMPTASGSTTQAVPEPTTEVDDTPAMPPAIPAHAPEQVVSTTSPEHELELDLSDDPLAGAALLSDGLDSGASESEEPGVVANLTPRVADSEHVAYNSDHFSETGPVRDHNEDSILNREADGLWVVADGMGGHAHGEYASQEITRQLARLPLQGDLVQRVELIRATLNDVNASIQKFARDQGTTCGSTVVVALAEGTQFAVIWAGDSRLYQFSSNTVKQITRDHDGSELDDPEFADPSAGRQTNLITRAVGAMEVLETEVRYFAGDCGDRLLLCSDGVYGCINDSRLLEILGGNGELDSIAGTLKDAVLEAGADDNFSAIIIEVLPAAIQSPDTIL